jgi:hypothetical protein
MRSDTRPYQSYTGVVFPYNWYWTESLSVLHRCTLSTQQILNGICCHKIHGLNFYLSFEHLELHSTRGGSISCKIYQFLLYNTRDWMQAFIWYRLFTDITATCLDRLATTDTESDATNQCLVISRVLHCAGLIVPTYLPAAVLVREHRGNCFWFLLQFVRSYCLFRCAEFFAWKSCHALH